MLHQLIWLLVICVVVSMVWWLADYVPFPPPLNKLAKVISVVIGIIACIIVLLQLAGMAIPS
jgi:hypothetical protein